MSELTPIEEVSKTYDPERIVYLTNPFKEDFTHGYQGRPATVEAGACVTMTEPKARHLAKHMAIQALLEGKARSELKWRDKNPDKAFDLGNKYIKPTELTEYANALITDEPPETAQTA